MRDRKTSVLNDFNCEYKNKIVKLSKMIKPHVNCKSQPLWHYVTQYLLCCRKRRHVTSCYSSHGLFYVLIILIYGSYLLNSPYGILAQQLNELQLMITSLSNDSNNSEAFNASKSSKNNEKLAVAAAAIAEAVKMDNGNTYEEYFDDDLDKEYEDLINNKSGELIHQTDQTQSPLWQTFNSPTYEIDVIFNKSMI